MRVRTFLKKTLRIHLGTSQQMPAHPSCVLQWMPLRRYGSVLMPKRETHACSWLRSLPWSAIQLVRIIAQNNSIQHTTIRSALERFVPSCPEISFGRPYNVVVVHGAIVESGCVLDVDSERSSRSQGYLLGRFCRQRYVLTIHFCGCIISEWSLYSFKTKHTPA